MNSVILMGRLTKDPEIREGKDFIVARYTLAVDRPYWNKDGERDADFIRCQAFGAAAEFAETYLEKGMMIAVKGQLRTGSYEDKDDRTVYTTDVSVEQHFFTGTMKKSDEGDTRKKSDEGDTRKERRKTRR